MRIIYFLSVLILGLYITAAPEESSTSESDVTTDNTSELSSTQSIIIVSSTEKIPEGTTNKDVPDESTKVNLVEISTAEPIVTTTIITTTSDSFTPKPIYSTTTVPPNPTRAIIGGIAGGLSGIGLIILIVSIYMCYKNSRQRSRAFTNGSTNPNDIPLQVVSSY